MTNSDYAAIARATKALLDRLDSGIAFDRAGIAAIYQLVDIYCEVFAEDNPAFDERKFREACGFKQWKGRT